MSSLARTAVPSKLSLIKILLPLCLLAFMGCSVTFLNSIFTDNTRWISLFILFLVMFFNNYLIRFFDVRLLIGLFLYLLWCLSTTFWSDVPILSFLKSSALFIVALTMISAGIAWVKKNRLDKTLDYLWIILIIGLFAGFLGKSEIDTPGVLSSEVFLYKGLTSNANMLGVILAMSFPLLLWRMYSQWKTNRLLNSILILGNLYFLMLSLSRASMLIVCTILLCFIFSLNLTRKIRIILLSMIVALFLAITISFNLLNVTSFVNKFMYKNDYKSLSASREDVWKYSYDAAVQGGWFGLGYGVSWGSSGFNLEYGLSVKQYGREKGCSQLSIIEETGQIGIFLYLSLLFILFKKIKKMYKIAENKETKVLLSIVTGTLLGMIVQSLFEAWFDAPAAPESIYFWTLVGVIRGLEIHINQAHYVKFRVKT